MNRSDLIAQRLRNQKLSRSELKEPADVVRWLGAVQAQDFNAAKWAVGLRMRKATDALVEKAFNDGQVIRTHLLRPTWHFVVPDDIRWLLQLTAPRVNLRSEPNYRKYELDAGVFKQSNKVLTKALRGGKHMTRSALREKLNQSGVDASDPVRLAHIMLRAELDGVVCSGPLTGKQFTYALLDERVALTTGLDRDEALQKLTLRYFASHGPATLQDFVWWSGLTTEDARRGIESGGPRLEKASIAEKVYWITRSSLTQQPLHSAHLLPGFDEYFVAYKDRQTTFALNHRSSSLTSWDLLGPNLISNGTVAGSWKRKDEKNCVTIMLTPSRPWKKTERLALAAAADRYAAFLGLPAKTLVSA